MARLKKKSSPQARVNMAVGRSAAVGMPARARGATSNKPPNQQQQQGSLVRKPVVGVAGAGRPGIQNPASGFPSPKKGAGPAPPPTPLPATPAPGPPPATVRGAGMRTTALSTYQNAVNNYRQGLVNAALRIGAPEVINALIADPNYAQYVGALQQGMQDPNSEWSTYAKQQTQGLEDTDIESNSRNAFFGGFRLDDRNELVSEFDRARAEAMGNYRIAQNEATTGLGQAKTDYEGVLLDADAWDREQALANAPEPAPAPHPVWGYGSGANQGFASGAPAFNPWERARKRGRR